MKLKAALSSFLACLLFACALPVSAQTDVPELHLKAAEKKQMNSDTVGWLMVPDTSIDDVILHYPDDANQYYLRRDFEKKYSFNGSYYADFRCRFAADGLRVYP